jgi:hypothetical protein
MQNIVESVIEIETSRGLAYGHVTHEHPKYGTLVRIVDRTWTTRPPISAIFDGTGTQFQCFFPVGAAVRQGVVDVIGKFPLSPQETEFPLFRTGTPQPGTTQVATWWLWDGKRSWRVGSLTEELRELPIRGIWNYELLKKRIENCWRASADAR